MTKRHLTDFLPATTPPPFTPARLWTLLVSLTILGLITCYSSRPACGADFLCGGWSKVSITNECVISATIFAIKAQEQAITQKKPTKPSPISLIEILEAKQQVVAGMNYGLRLKVKVGGMVKEAEAVVWRKLDGEHVLTSWVWK